MYFYLYDSYLREKKYEGVLVRIEARLLELGIQGKSEKLTVLKSMKEVVQSAIKRGAETIVVVGNDTTFSRIVDIIADENVVLGYISVGEPNILARHLGIPQAEKGCDLLSQRIIKRIDVGRANDAYFVSFLTIAPGKQLYLECEGYSIEPIGTHSISIYNFGEQGKDPHDGVLELVIQQTQDERKKGLFSKAKDETDATLLPIRTMKIKSYAASLPAHADGQTVVKTPLTVSVIPKKLQLIVGKHRTFV